MARHEISSEAVKLVDYKGRVTLLTFQEAQSVALDPVVREAVDVVLNSPNIWNDLNCLLLHHKNTRPEKLRRCFCGCGIIIFVTNSLTVWVLSTEAHFSYDMSPEWFVVVEKEFGTRLDDAEMTPTEFEMFADEIKITENG